MAYVAPIHKPTSIRHAIRAQLPGQETGSLVLAKSNRLEIWRVENDGMTLLHSKIIFGTVSVLQRLRPKDSESDLLFVGTDEQEYFTLSWNPSRQILETVQELHDQPEPHMREAECQPKCVVDPSGRFMALHIWEGVLNISRLIDRGDSKHFIKFLEQVRLTELFIKSSTFLHSQTGPRIAFLYQTRIDEEDSKLAIYRLTGDDRHATAAKFEPRERQLDLEVPDRLSKILIPVPIVEDENKRYHVRNASSMRRVQPHLGGVVVVGETSVQYVDSQDFSTIESPLPEGNVFIAWESYDVTRYFLADDFGRLHLLTLVTDGTAVTGIEVSPLGPITTSRASTLVYMGAGLLFVGSHYGNSQLIRVDVEALKSELAPIPPAFSNNAPILDFVIMDMGNREGDSLGGNTFSSGQARLVAGCGVFESGSLRSIRSGVGLEDLGILDEFSNVKGLFSLASNKGKKTDILVVSSVTDTRVFKFDDEGGIEELASFGGLKLDNQTLLVSSLPTGELLQVTPNTVRLLDLEGGIVTSSWEPPTMARDDGSSAPGLITSASANNDWVLLSVDGMQLVSLSLQQHLKGVTKALNPSTRSERGDQISCLHASPAISNVGVIGFWESASITLCDLETLTPLHGESMPRTEDSASVPREVVLVQVHPPDVSGPTLLVAMEDGHVVTFNVSKQDVSLSGRKSVILGTRQARLHVLPDPSGFSNVFATTENASLIHSTEGRLVYSATTAEDAIYVVPFDSEAYPDSIIIASGTHLKLSQLDTERRTQINAFPLGETVRRLAYSPTLKAFGLGCLVRTLNSDPPEEIVQTRICLVDEVMFELLGEPYLLPAPDGHEIPECIIRAELPDSNGELVERFIVGTSISADPTTGNPPAHGGQILVLGVDSDRKLFKVSSKLLQGACKCLGVLEGQIVAGLSTSIIIYKYIEESTTSAQLQSLIAYRSSTYPIDLCINGNIIGVADVMKSLTLLNFEPGSAHAPPKLQPRARHFQPAWATAVCHIENESWLESDSAGNLMVLRERTDAVLEQERQRMEVTSALNLGEQVNRIRPLNVVSSERAAVAPKAFLGTADGGIYLFGTISPRYQDLLMTFQTKLASFVESPGGTSFAEWRASNSIVEHSGPFRFVDGGFLELFLDMSEETQELVCEGLGPNVEDMRNLIEEIRRLH
ncbi:hypothetical protein jhhlp_003870 [Lomentospora prolificans]|uniref:DNA damage-binding protein 1 n=1 Tax=Lomentospora prolificans TaxID=41688 RepID=A0A2N3N9Y3_9PEZI|nr:hypothetical protein jhhlp_003870 [Lomentospora prolificans]